MLLSLVIFFTVATAFAHNGEQFAEVFAGDEGLLQYSIQSDDNSQNSIVVYSEKENSLRGENQLESLTIPDAPDFVIPPQVLRFKRESDENLPPWLKAWRQRYENYHAMHGDKLQAEPQSSPISHHIRRKKTTTTESPTITTTTEEPTDEPTDEPTTHRRHRHKHHRKVKKSSATGASKFRRQFSDLDREKDEDWNSIQNDFNQIDQEEETTQATTTTTTTTKKPETAHPDITSFVDVLIADMRQHEGKQTIKPVWPPVLDMEQSWMQAEPDLDPRKSATLRQMIVDKHNYLRSQVYPAAGNMLKMEWSNEAAKQAQHWAEQCQFKHDSGDMRKTKDFKCGQNLARGWPKPLSWNLTQQLWFDERKDFNFDASPRGMVGHYTQLVWAQSYQLGCGYADCGTFHHYVCNYCPAGNVDTRKYKPYLKSSEFCDSCKGSCDGKLCTNPCPFVNKFGNCNDLDKEFGVCKDASFGLQDSCKATCQCQGKIF